jgi:hypothetical protein
MITHPLFVDDIFCNVYGLNSDLSALKAILKLFGNAIGMWINMEKSCIILNNYS